MYFPSIHGLDYMIRFDHMNYLLLVVFFHLQY